jgi:RNA polymerase sigma-70 factor (ECF subfamily)
MKTSTTDFPEEFSAHRPALLRHCYRMLGSFADAEDLVQEVLLRAWRSRDTYAGEVPLDHWLFRIATNACLNELARRKRRGLPQLEVAPARPNDPLEELDAADWLTPAPDAKLFEGPARALETRESVALAFLALLQRLPQRQRAVLLPKDVVLVGRGDRGGARALTRLGQQRAPPSTRDGGDERGRAL